ncbi:MAG: DUF2793 domain-containing protein [Pseudomonadota bacterium]
MSRTLPGIAITGDYGIGANGWGPTNNVSLLRLSALVQPRARSRVTDLPVSPAAGDIYLVPSTAMANANSLAIWDGAPGQEAWVYLPAQVNWRVWVEDEARELLWTGVEWINRTGVGDPVELVLAASDETSDLAVGAAAITFRMPYAMTLTEVRANVVSAPVGAALQVDINQGANSVLTTVVSIDDGEKTSQSGQTPPIIATSALLDDAEITVDIDQVGSTTAGAGLKVLLKGLRA